MKTIAVLLAFCASSCATAAAADTLVRIETSQGELVVSLDSVRAPATVANFLRYVDAGMYDGGRFHRTVTTQPDNQPSNTVKIDVIQAGPSPEQKEFPPIAIERTSTTGLRHLDATISMARGGPDTATGDFFICLGPQPELDFGGKRNADGQGFAAFGKVIRGMDVVRKIQSSPSEGQKLSPPVRIVKAARIER